MFQHTNLYQSFNVRQKNKGPAAAFSSLPYAFRILKTLWDMLRMSIPIPDPFLDPWEIQMVLLRLGWLGQIQMVRECTSPMCIVPLSPDENLSLPLCPVGQVYTSLQLPLLKAIYQLAVGLCPSFIESKTLSILSIDAHIHAWKSKKMIGAEPIVAYNKFQFIFFLCYSDVWPTFWEVTGLLYC